MVMGERKKIVTPVSRSSGTWWLRDWRQKNVLMSDVA